MTMTNEAGECLPPCAEHHAITRLVQLLQSNNPDLTPSAFPGAGQPAIGLVAGWMVDVNLNAPPPARMNSYFDDAWGGQPGGSAHWPYLRLDLHWLAVDRVMLSIVTHGPDWRGQCRRWIPVLSPATNAVLLVAADKSCSAMLRPDGGMAIQPGVPIPDRILDHAANMFFRVWRLCVPLYPPFPRPLAVSRELGAF